MSRDVKPKRQAAKKARGGTLVGLFIGLVLGVLGAAAVVWYINKMPMPFTTKSAPPPARPETAKAAPATAATPAPLPGKPGDPVPQGGDKPRFDFYKILPGNAEAIPEPKPAEPRAAKEAKPDAKAEAKAEAKTEARSGEPKAEAKDPIFLQAGSFQNSGDADNQKAKLALMGLEASVQQVMLQDKVWYRVRLGPYSRVDDVNRTRADLAKQGIDATIVKKTQE